MGHHPSITSYRVQVPQKKSLIDFTWVPYQPLAYSKAEQRGPAHQLLELHSHQQYSRKENSSIWNIANKKKKNIFSLGSMKGLTNVSIRTGKKCLSHFYSNKRHHQILTIEWNNQQIISEPDHLCIYKALLLNLSSKTKLSHPFRTFYIPLQSMTSSLHLHFALTIKCHHKKLYYQYFIFMTLNLFNRQSSP